MTSVKDPRGSRKFHAVHVNATCMAEEVDIRSQPASVIPVEMQFQWMRNRKPFDDEAKRQELRNRLNKIAGVQIPANAIARRPSFPLSVLTDAAAMNEFRLCA